MPNFRCTVVIPTRQLFVGEIAYAEIPGYEGNFGVMDGHEMIVSTHRPGVVTLWLDAEGKEKLRFVLYEGATQMVGNFLTIMGRFGCKVDDIDAEDVSRKAEAMKDTIAELEKKTDDVSHSSLEIERARLAWYETQLAVVNKTLL